jgi:hypothetical protein
MANKPIKVKTYHSPIESTRKELMDEENDKIQGRRGFILKGFKTEKQRIVINLLDNFIIIGRACSK